MIIRWDKRLEEFIFCDYDKRDWVTPVIFQSFSFADAFTCSSVCFYDDNFDVTRRSFQTFSSGLMTSVDISNSVRHSFRLHNSNRRYCCARNFKFAQNLSSLVFRPINHFAMRMMWCAVDKKRKEFFLPLNSRKLNRWTSCRSRCCFVITIIAKIFFVRFFLLLVFSFVRHWELTGKRFFVRKFHSSSFNNVKAQIQHSSHPTPNTASQRSCSSVMRSCKIKLRNLKASFLFSEVLPVGVRRHDEWITFFFSES